ncbi:hypothetical protein EV640_1121 [Nesterenkonia aurantiaca]|uniref:Uncharacterized protein n=1 Tax=Nesterenkonia aurantiaca TaxID=1436010 RepID=A0A4R7FW26_9MICC|nr:hypothetical protein EV640_1121 [Nesterenkonia aurantiaca]
MSADDIDYLLFGARLIESRPRFPQVSDLIESSR